MAILKFDINGKYIAIYHTITEAAEDKKSDVGNIHKCIHGILDKINGNYFIEIDNPKVEKIEEVEKIVSHHAKIKNEILKMKNEKMSNIVKSSLTKKNKNVELEKK